MLYDELPRASSPAKPIITELCDVCGCSCDTDFILRTVYYTPQGIRYVIRHHPTCNPLWHYNKIMNVFMIK